MSFVWWLSFALCFVGFGGSLADGDVNALSLVCVVAWLALFAAHRHLSHLPPRWLPVRVRLATGDTLDAVARRRWRRDEHGHVQYLVSQFDGSKLPDVNSDAVV